MAGAPQEQSDQRRRQMARHGALLLGVSAAVTTIGLLAPHQEQVDETGLAVAAMVTAALALLLTVAGRRLPFWAYHLIVACGTVLVSLALLFNGERDGGAAGGDEVYYLWVVIYAAHYMGRAATAVQVALIGIAYAITLAAIDPGPVATSRWLTMIGLVAGTAVVIRLLTERAERTLAELDAAARTDGLTNLANRRGFEHEFRREVARAARGGKPFSVLLLDLDHFKQLNDEYGHAAGDEALVGVGELLRAELRDVDTTARMGGDEFAVLLPEALRDQARLVGVRLAQAMQRRRATEPARLTLSFGVAEYPFDGATLDELMRAADRALYEDKRKRTRDERPLPGRSVAGAPR